MPSPSLKTHSGTETKSYTSIAADIDCVAVRPGLVATDAPHAFDNEEKRPRQVIVHDVGNLVVEYDDDGTITDTIPILVAPTYLAIQPRKIESTNTTVTNITLVW